MDGGGCVSDEADAQDVRTCGLADPARVSADSIAAVVTRRDNFPEQRNAKDERRNAVVRGPWMLAMPAREQKRPTIAERRGKQAIWEIDRSVNGTTSTYKVRD